MIKFKIGKMLKNYIYITITAIFYSLQSNAQSETMSITWEKPSDSDFIIRPLEISPHAYLFESDQVNFKAYYWIEYLEKLNNGIHKIKIYEKNGYKSEVKYYFTLEADSTFSVDTTKEYIVEDAISNVIEVRTKEDGADFYLFNYNAEDDSYRPNVGFRGSNKDEYVLVTSLSDNPFFGKAEGVCKLAPEMDVWISIKKSEGAGYKVSIQDEFGKFTTANYLLKNEHAIGSTPSFPFHVKYYHMNTGNIYLVEQGWLLEKEM